MKVTSLVAALLICGTTALYSAEAAPDVVELTADNFKSKVLDSDGLWMVEFYAPWCGHCKNLVPEWTKLAAGFKGLVNVGAVDMTVHGTVGEPYDVSGFPTIKVFGADKSKPSTYEGDRSATKMAAGAIAEIKVMLRARWGLNKPSAKKAPSKPAAGGALVELTKDSFQNEVMESQDLWLVEFYAPWCGHCKNLAPEWKAAAETLKGKAKLGAVDATVHSALAQKYNVNGYPTIKVFAKGDKSDPTDYDGGRDRDGIVEYTLELLGEKPDDGIEDKTVTLTDDSFDAEVLGSKDLWIVEFFAPWCGHCKQLKPHWKKAALELDGKVKLATVDCTKQSKLQEKYEIKSFPTIKVFSNDKTSPTDYEGGRTDSSIVSSALELLEDHNTEPKPVVELVSDEVFTTNCAADSSSLCLVAFLPHILDTGADGRNKVLTMFENLTLKYKKKGVGFMWVEGFQQTKLEQVFDLGNGGYPAVVLMNRKKSRYVQFLSSWSEESLVRFIDGVFSGKERTIPLPALPSLETIAPWDGKDGEVPKEEL